jgi:hypothetical protein
VEIGCLLSVPVKPTTIMSVVCGICAPMLLAQVAMLLKVDFLGNPDSGIGTRALLSFLALVSRLLGRFQIVLLVGADAFDRFHKVRSKRMSIGIMPFLFMLYWSCHWIEHIRST